MTVEVLLLMTQPPAATRLNSKRPSCAGNGIGNSRLIADYALHIHCRREREGEASEGMDERKEVMRRRLNEHSTAEFVSQTGKVQD